MKKVVFLFILVLAIVAIGGPFYLIVTNRVILRAPVLYTTNPRVYYAYGDVRYKADPGEAEWHKAIVGTSLPAGAVLETGPDSRADVAFTGEMVIRIAENSRFVVNRADIKAKEMELQKGALYGKFERQYQEQTITVRTPTAVASVRGTELGFEIGEEERSRLVSSDEAESETPDEGTKEPSEAKTEKESPKKDQTEKSGKIPTTTIYAISGIVEVGSSTMEDSKILLSYQSRTTIGENLPPSNPEKIDDAKTQSLRQILNSIHMEEVLFITDKVRFDFNSAHLKTESYKELDHIADALKDRREKIRIEGHTDNRGLAHINQRLSEQRASAIKDYLVGKGINPDRLSIKGYGDSRPIVPNDTEPHRAENRRVEFVIVQ